MFGKTDVVSGKLAVSNLFKDLQSRPETKKGPPTVGELELFRMFKWCLTQGQGEILDGYVKDAATNRRLEIDFKQLLDVPDDADPKKKKKKTCAANELVVSTLSFPLAASSSKDPPLSSPRKPSSAGLGTSGENVANTRAGNIRKLFQKRGVN